MAALARCAAAVSGSIAAKAWASFSRLVHVEKLGLPTVFLQCRGKVAAVMAEEVTARRHEEAGRESGDQRRIFGVDVFPERRMPPTAAIDYVREENADVVKAGRIQYKYDLPGAC